MPFGRGDKNTLKRMISVGVGDVTALKRDVFEALRVRYISLLNEMVDAAWVEPWDKDDDALSKALFEIQKKAVSNGLKSVYAERARLDVSAKIKEQWKRFEGGLRWRLGNAAREIDGDERSRRWYAVPAEIEETVAADELESLASFGSRRGHELFTLFLGTANVALSETQKHVVAEILEQTRRRCGKPVYRPDATIQLMMDSRWWSKDSPFVDTFGPAVKILVDRANARYQSFVSLTHPFGRGHVRLPLIAAPATTKRLLTGAERRRALVLEIGETAIAFKVVFDKAEPVVDVAGRTAIVGRDFGYRNTISLSVVEADCTALETTHGAVENLGKTDAKAFLKGRTHRPKVLETLQLSGENFLDAIRRKAERIDELRSRIDKAYNELESMLGTLKANLGLDSEDRLERSMPGTDAFFSLLDGIGALKARRRRLYDRIRALKKCWFGYASNRELELACRHNAVVVVEDLTVMAAEKNKPGYKGRTFNRMINNGSKGQYLRRAADKLLWNGVPELAVPSYYTSTFCHLTGVVEKSQRRGDTFTSKLGGYSRDADLHASETIACYLLLTPQAST